MISLQGVKPFAEGGNRLCFIHPNNNKLCLKISKPEVIEKLYLNAPWYKKLRMKRSFDDNYREERAYKQRAIKENPKKIWKHLARWYEFIDWVGELKPSVLQQHHQRNRRDGFGHGIDAKDGVVAHRLIALNIHVAR